MSCATGDQIAAPEAIASCIRRIRHAGHWHRHVCARCHVSWQQTGDAAFPKHVCAVATDYAKGGAIAIESYSQDPPSRHRGCPAAGRRRRSILVLPLLGAASSVDRQTTRFMKASACSKVPSHQLDSGYRAQATTSLQSTQPEEMTSFNGIRNRRHVPPPSRRQRSERSVLSRFAEQINQAFRKGWPARGKGE
jgi:hypothetical protein